MEKNFPVEFSKPVRDFAVCTPLGPYMGTENVDSFDTTLKVLPYINETEAYDAPQMTNHPTVAVALDRLRHTAREKFTGPDREEDFYQKAMGQFWYAKGLPYYDGPTRTNALASLRKYFSEELLVTNRFNSAGGGKLNWSLLESIWAYAHFSGDWGLLKERWAIIKKIFRTRAETRWAGFGRDATAELGDEGGPCLAVAR